MAARKKAETDKPTKAAPARGRKKSAAPAADGVVKGRAPRKKAAAEPTIDNDGTRGSHDLVIVESPAKAKTINKYLGPNFKVLASYGHVRDLPRKKRKGEDIAGVRIAEGWVPTYVVSDKDDGKGAGKSRFQRRTPKDILSELKREAGKANRIFLATDPDREGEAIAWHIEDELKLPEARTYRIAFNEITRSAVQNALQHPGKINMDLVRSQEARRILDRIVGYPLSGLLGKKVSRGLSAGRVQSVAVRLIVEREREIEAFKTEEYWKLTALLAPEELREKVAYTADPARSKIFAKKKGEKDEAAAEPTDEEKATDAPAIPKPPAGSFIAELTKWDGQEPVLKSEADADKYLGALNGATWTVTKIEQKDRYEKPQAPFTTSTLQQQANLRLRFSASRTMQTAQKLYEGVDLGSEGAVGLITYMRTDSTRVSNDALTAVRQHIQASYGPAYLPASPNMYASGKSAQEAHEAVRPTDLAQTPQRVQAHLTPDQFRLYQLIYNRFVASQMTPAVFAVTSVEVTAAAGLFKARGEIEKFDGYRKVQVAIGKKEDVTLPPMKDGQALAKLDLFSSQHFTKPPARFNEASLVKSLEKEGIGRPSTYASIIETIQRRGYVRQEDRKFFATEIGKVVTDLLVQHFPDVLDMKFTSHFEEELDQIERREIQYEAVLNEFWGPFSEALKKAEEQMPKKSGEATGEMCPKCGKPLVKRYAKKTGKEFISCSGWKKDGTGCDYVKRPEGEEGPRVLEDIKCPNCGKPMVQRAGFRGVPFLGCSGYPECKTTMKLTAEGKAEVTAKPTEFKCDKCGSPMVIRTNRRGVQFLACTGYPKCKYACDLDENGQPIKPPDLGLACEKCGEPMVIKRGPRGPFLSCSGYPKCKNAKPLTAELKEKLKDVLPSPPKKDTGPKIEITETCPECGAPMKLRNSARGSFLGCSKYPKCKGTREVSEELMEKIAAAGAIPG
ncbi:MAG: type I DNA topoisomerase [Gemmataceae bacterium]